MCSFGSVSSIVVSTSSFAEMQGSEINSHPFYIVKLQIFHKILGNPFKFLWANFILEKNSFLIQIHK